MFYEPLGLEDASDAPKRFGRSKTACFTSVSDASALRLLKNNVFYDRFGPFWASLGLSGILWGSLGLSRPLWASLGLSGPLWASLGLSGPLWASLGISGLSGHLWASLSLSGPLWASLGISGPLWASLGFERSKIREAGVSKAASLSHGLSKNVQKHVRLSGDLQA